MVFFQYLVLSAGDFWVSSCDVACADQQSGLANSHLLQRSGDRSGHPVDSREKNRGFLLAKYFILGLGFRNRRRRAAR